MNAIPEFDAAHAEFLIRFLSAPERPARTFRYEEAAGFIFAVACVPEAIPPSEWVPLVFDDEEPNYADGAEAAAFMNAILALYNRTVGEVTDPQQATPTLPPRCAPLPEPMANFGPDAPLGRWAGGFGAGHDWLEEAWPAELPQEADEYLGVALMTLTFFESRELAESYLGEVGGAKQPLETWAAQMLEAFPDAMRGYAQLAAAMMAAE